jgi:cytochrome c5
MRSTMLSDTPRRPRCRARFLTAVIASAAALAGPALAADRTAVEVVNGQCAKCHQPGTANAPKIGDKAAWVQRLKFGVDPLVYSGIRGHGGMPPRGGRADLTDSELRAAILYMYDPAGPPKDLPKSTAMPILPGAGPQRASAGGLDIYFGRVSAERLRAYPAGSAEMKIHGGIPSGTGYHHVNVSLFEAGTQTPVTGASVVLEVEKTGLGKESKALEAVTVAGGTSYGGYVRLAPKSDYAFVAKVTRPGAPPAEVRFRDKTD